MGPTRVDLDASGNPLHNPASTGLDPDLNLAIPLDLGADPMTTAPRPRRLPGFAATLLVGLGVGWFAASVRAPAAKALSGGADRFGDYAVTTATIAMDYDEATKIQAPQEAIFFLDYRAARLLTTIPTLKQSMGGTQIIEGFAERDLASDFKLSDSSPKPHFVMTSGSYGAKGARWAPLFVFETISRQVAVYRVQSQSVGKVVQPKFDLLEVKSFAASPPLPDLPGSTSPDDGPGANRR